MNLSLDHADNFYYKSEYKMKMFGWIANKNEI